jgi:hypothetical protein
VPYVAWLAFGAVLNHARCGISIRLYEASVNTSSRWQLEPRIVPNIGVSLRADVLGYSA